MLARRSSLVLLVATGLLVGGTSAQALPKKDDPIDPAKRAPISTADAIRPAATPVKGDGVIGGRVVRMSEIPVNRATVGDERAAIAVRETRGKQNVRKPEARAIAARTYHTTRAGDRPATLPRIDADRFRKMLHEYEKGRTPAAELVSGDIQIGRDRVSLADINRFASPRAALEAQGIPVTQAASSDAPASTDSAPVPVAQEKNGVRGK